MNNELLVPVFCHTNIDEFKRCVWPTKMYNPKVDDWVRSCSIEVMELRIYKITHCFDKNNEPMLDIYLYRWEEDL
jgi:hypothetical protein